MSWVMQESLFWCHPCAGAHRWRALRTLRIQDKARGMFPAASQRSGALRIGVVNCTQLILETRFLLFFSAPIGQARPGLSITEPGLSILRR